MSTLKVGAIRGVSASSDAITVASDGTCTANVTNNLSNRNKVGNGAMLCAQRGTSFSPNASAQIYTLDRFQHIATSGAAFDATVTQDSSAPAGFSKSYKVTPDNADTPSGGGNACIRTKIEGQDIQELAYGGSDAKKVTVSFYAKSASQNNGQQYTFQLRHFATDGTQRSINAPFTITSSFQRFTFSFVGDTAVDIIKTIALGMELVWHLASGPDDITSQQTTWVTTNLFTCVTGQSNFLDNTSNEFYFTGVQLEVDHTGSGKATDFEHRSFHDERQRCYRYFQRWATGDGADIGLGCYFNGSQINIVCDLFTPMRATPTLSMITGTHYYVIYRDAAADTFNSLTIDTASPDRVNVKNNSEVSGSGGQTGFARCNNAAPNGGQVDFIAEL